MQKIEFVVRDGVKDLDRMLQGNFNTFRHGNKWTRLKVGETVELMSFVKGPTVVEVGNFKKAAGDQHAVLGFAVVTGVAFGPLGDMLMDYADGNYEAQDEAELAGVLASVYGPENVSRHEAYTVVHLVRLTP